MFMSLPLLGSLPLNGDLPLETDRGKVGFRLNINVPFGVVGKRFGLSLSLLSVAATSLGESGGSHHLGKVVRLSSELGLSPDSGTPYIEEAVNGRQRVS